MADGEAACDTVAAEPDSSSDNDNDIIYTDFTDNLRHNDDNNDYDTHDSGCGGAGDGTGCGRTDQRRDDSAGDDSAAGGRAGRALPELIYYAIEMCSGLVTTTSAVGTDWAIRCIDICRASCIRLALTLGSPSICLCSCRTSSLVIL